MLAYTLALWPVLQTILDKQLWDGSMA